MKDTPHGRMTLTEQEFKAAFSEMFPNGDAAKFSSQVFQIYDQDGDGSLGKQW